jgi:hypothetical protein
MITFVGVCNTINWSLLIDKLKFRTPDFIGPRHKSGDVLPGLTKIADMWEHAGYSTLDKGGTVSWDMFLPGPSFDQSIVEQFADYIGLSTIHNCWISRVNPGYVAPIHWDVNDNEVQLSTEPDKLRWHCHIGKSEFGHIFIVDDKCLYNQLQGATYQWSSRKLWHAGTNCGTVPKYILNIW